MNQSIRNEINVLNVSDSTLRLGPRSYCIYPDCCLFSVFYCFVYILPKVTLTCRLEDLEIIPLIF